MVLPDTTGHNVIALRHSQKSNLIFYLRFDDLGSKSFFEVK